MSVPVGPRILLARLLLPHLPPLRIGEAGAGVVGTVVVSVAVLIKDGEGVRLLVIRVAEAVMLPLGLAVVVQRRATVHACLVQDLFDQFRSPGFRCSRDGGFFLLRFGRFGCQREQQIFCDRFDPFWRCEHPRNTVRTLRNAVALAGFRSICLGNARSLEDLLIDFHGAGVELCRQRLEYRLQ
jgi:hypothetical protein